MIVAYVTSKLLEQKLKAFEREFKVSGQKLLKQQVRLLARDLAFETAPYGLSKSSQKMGENTIKGDIIGRVRANGETTTNRQPLFFVIDEPKVRKNFKASPTGEQKLWINKDGKVYAVEKTFFKPNASIDEMRAHHKRYYKNGRRTRAGSFTRDVGRWRFIDKMTVGKRSLTNYLKYIFQRVGLSKAGWVKAGSTFGKVTGIPAWVMRHMGKARGSAKIKRTGQHSAAISLTNKIPWSDKVLSKGQIDSVLQLNKEKFIDHLTHRARGEAKKKFNG